ncbi:DgyrCDS11943 [Dimorphilus gyrociliatus]|uniref:DgyrCDS11943 n=1 Tax=Dimorphilus gyrociliatus TaxID=2664684 RepID=A0A7I8W4Y4_9ANNE|nr:DgyrCDS11943 [Dimorphilus gyrociliatus]
MDKEKVSQNFRSAVGGSDPIDGILIFLCREETVKKISKHWHYVGLGLSDIHSTEKSQTEKTSLELTFRLKYAEESQPPVWPLNILYSLSEYMLESGNLIRVGDHIPWKRSIDPINPNSRIRNFIVAEDPILKTLNLPSGPMQFRQLVGITDDELRAAQNYKGKSLLTMLTQDQSLSGAHLITDVLRNVSIFETNPKYGQVLQSLIDNEGSKFAHVSANCRWIDTIGSSHLEAFNCATDDEDDEIENLLEEVKIEFDPSAAQLLPNIVARGRLPFQKYLAFQSLQGQVIVFIPENLKSKSQTCIVSKSRRLCSSGKTLQIYCDKEFINQLSTKLDSLSNSELSELKFPMHFNLDNPNVAIEVLPTRYFLGIVETTF